MLGVKVCKMCGGTGVKEMVDAETLTGVICNNCMGMGYDEGYLGDVEEE